MVKMRFFRPTRKFLFLSFLILSTGASYMYISYNGVELKESPKEIVTGTSPVEKENWDSLAEAEKEQSRRLATFKTYCEKTSSMVDPSQAQVKSHLLFFDNIKTAYCYVPKTGCTTMKLLLYNLEHNKTERLISVSEAEWLANQDNYTAHEHWVEWIHLNRQFFKTLKDYSEKEARQRLATYKKIIVVRDPLERLASAWLNKFVNLPKQSVFMWVSLLNHHLRRYRQRHPPDKSSKVKEEGTFNARKPVPFRDFLFAVSKKLIEDEHWISFNRLCLPCQIDYDFIAHTDTIASDVRLFLKKNNMTANEDVLPEQRPRDVNADNVFGDIYGQIPIEDILPLREIYQADFDMFGYSFEQDLAKIREEKAREFETLL